MSEHDIKIDAMIGSDNPEKPFAVFDNPKQNGDYIARAYRKGDKWMLVSDEEYNGGGLVVVINNRQDVELKVDSYIRVTKILPNVVIGNVI